MAHVAVYTILHDTETERVLLLERKNTGYMDGCISLPAGHVDKFEPPFIAASRELAEETGLIVAVEDWTLAALNYVKTSDRRNTDIFLLAREWSGVLENKEPEKAAWVEFKNINALNGLFDNYVKEVILSVIHKDAILPQTKIAGFDKPIN